jgi:transforming growth factor-beta-induced protein
MKMNTIGKGRRSLVNRLVLTLAFAAALVFVSGCSDDDDGPSQADNTIVDIAKGNANLSSLVAALTKYPDLVTTLSSNNEVTVFAPTNAAFTALLTAIGQTSIDDIPADVLRDVLEYHVVTSGAVRSSELTSGNVEAANGEDIAVSVTSGVRLNGSANVTTADVEASNGIVHVIDAVLVPPSMAPIVGTIVAPAYFNKNFTTLIAAVKAADASILTTLLGNGPSNKKLTLFAPTNAAFTAAGISTLPDRATLNDILAYHVIDDEVRSTELPSGSATIPTLGGNFYLSNNGAAGIFINGTTKVTTADIVRSNGVVHVIDRTLVPPSKTIAEIATDLSTANTPQFTQLVAALARTSGTDTDLLAAVSNGEANLTVFAPTDAAFEQLYQALEVDGINDIPLSTLTAVLQHHVVAARVFSTDLKDGTVSTLNGDVTVNVANKTITDGSGNAATLSNTAALLNVLATNGVIHTIDRVLVPSLD